MQTTPDATPPAAPSATGDRLGAADLQETDPTDPSEPSEPARPVGRLRPTAAPARPTVPADPMNTVDLIDADTIQQTIGRALAHGSALPRYEELVELESLLRGHIHLLLPIARARAAVLRPTTAEWLRYRVRLDWITNQVGRDLGDGLLSARQQVRSLAHDCRWLLRQTPTWNRKATP